MKSSKESKFSFHMPADSFTLVARWNVASTFLSPQGFRTYDKVREGWWRAFSRTFSLTYICQYPALASRKEEIVASPSESIHSLIVGSEEKSLDVTALSLDCWRKALKSLLYWEQRLPNWSILLWLVQIFEHSVKCCALLFIFRPDDNLLLPVGLKPLVDGFPRRSMLLNLL